MIGSTRVKVCGLTRLEDARASQASGADALGFIFYPKSPRALTFERYAALRPDLPALPKVAVVVEPGLAELTAAQRAGFDAIQIHFKLSTPLAILREWSELVTPARLWLVPQLKEQAVVPPALLPLAETFLLDTYHAEKFGGTGLTGDWPKFRAHAEAVPEKTWILSGGLKPENIAEALRESAATFVDVNSGVESAPGVKDHAKLAALAAALRAFPSNAGGTP